MARGRKTRERDRASERGGDECMGFAFGRRRDSYGPVGTCCLLIKCKRAASLSLDSPLSANPPLLRRPRSVLSPFRPSPSDQEPEAALVSLRNQPRADNNEIHKSVREQHAEHPVPPRPGTSSLPLSLSRFFSDNTLYRTYSIPRAAMCLSRSASLRLRDP